MGAMYGLSLRDDTRQYIKQVTLAYCRQNTGLHVSVHAVGARSHRQISTALSVQEEPIFGRSEHRHCVCAAVSNGIQIHKTDAEMLLTLGPVTEERFGTVNSWMRDPRLRYTLQHCDVGTSTPDEWVMGQQDGLHLLAIRGSDYIGDEVEHMAVIDAGAQKIMESCEHNSLRMTWKALQRCVGDSTYQGAIGIRQLCRKEEGNSRKNHLRKQSKKKNL